MLQQRIGAPALNRTIVRPNTDVLVSHRAPIPATQPLDTPGSTTMQSVFQQLAQSLTMLSSEAESILVGKAAEPFIATSGTWLQPNARQAEAAMHRLRELQLVQSPAVTELSQSLTVLVLVADMLVQGQLSGADAVSSYELLRRNADRATKSLCELSALYAGDAQIDGQEQASVPDLAG